MVADLAGVMRDGGRFARCAAADVLGYMGPAAVGARQELLQAVQSPDDPARVMAVVAVGAIGREAQEAIPTLGQCLSSPDRDLQINASSGLGRFAESGVALPPAILRKGLAHAEADVRANILSAIGFLGTRAELLAPDVAAVLGDQNAHARAKACDALGAMDRAGLPYLERLRKLKADPDAEVRRSAREATGWLMMVERMPPDAVVKTQQ